MKTPYEGRKIEVLTVDDNFICRSTVAKFFEALGYEVSHAEIGGTALEILSDKIALVVTDIEMPAMDGSQLAYEIHETNKFIPIVAMTSLSTEQQSKLPREEFSDVISKPVTEEKCKQIIKIAGLTQSANHYEEKLLRAA